MKKTISRLLVLALVLALCSIPLGMDASATDTTLWTAQVSLTLDTADQQGAAADECSWFTRADSYPTYNIKDLTQPTNITAEEMLASVAKLVNEGYWKRTDEFTKDTAAEWTLASDGDGYHTVTNSVTQVQTKYRYDPESEKVYEYVYPDFKGKTILISQDIDLSAHLWEPIGTEAHPFRGTIQALINPTTGEYYQITGLKVNSSSAVSGTYGKYYGLCGVIESDSDSKASILYLTVTGDIEVTDNSKTAYVGAFAGKIDGENAELTQLTSKVAINSTSSSEVIIGGLAGEAWNTQVTTCSNDGTITVTDASKADVGGVFGIARNATLVVNKQVTTTGNYIGGTDENPNLNVTAKEANVGGIIGRLPNENSNTLTVTTNTKNVDYDASYLVNLGDIAVVASDTSGTVDVNVGGFIGKSEIAFTLKNARQIRNISVTGSGNVNVGGILGGQYGDGTATLDNCSLTTGILLKDNNEYTVLEKTVESAKISVEVGGKADVGGLVGYADKLSMAAPFVGGEPSNENSNVEIEVESTSSETGAVGGIAGHVESGAIAASEADMAKTLRLTVTAEDVTSVGGFLGDATLTDDFFAAPWDKTQTAGEEPQDVVVNATACQNVGGFIGKVSAAGKTLNLTAKDVTLTVTTPDPSSNIGGFIGENTASGAVTMAAANDVALNVSATGTVSNSNIGGFIGQNTTSGAVTAAANDVALNVSATETVSSSNLGGTIGLNTVSGDVTVTVAENTALTVTGDVTDSDVGGVIGENKNSTAVKLDAANAMLTVNGNVTKDSTGSNVGGVIGLNTVSGDVTMEVTEDNTLEDAETGYIALTVNGAVTDSDVGGVIGGTIGTNAASGDVTMTATNDITLTVTGNVGTSKLGGVIGENTESAAVELDATNAMLTVGGESTTVSDSKLGGTIGLNTTSGAVTMTVTADTALTVTGDVNTSEIGGVIGENAKSDAVELTATNAMLTVEGDVETSNLGGVIGLNTKSEAVTATVAGDTALAVTGDVTGTDIGGVIGGTIGENAASGDVTMEATNITLAVTGNVGTSKLGGVIGENTESAAVKLDAANATLTVEGDVETSDLGGTIGLNTKSGAVTVTVTADTALTVTGDVTDTDIGGVIGENAESAAVELTAKNAMLTVNGNVTKDSTGSNVGGVIGLNAVSGDVTVTATNDIKLMVNGTVTDSDVGGTIGLNKTSGAVSMTATNATLTVNGNVTKDSTGSNIAGTIGLNTKSGDVTVTATNDITLAVNGNVTGTGIGGVIGENKESTAVELTAKNAALTVEGNVGTSNIAGTIGLNTVSGAVTVTAEKITVTVKATGTLNVTSSATGGVIGTNIESGDVTVTADKLTLTETGTTAATVSGSKIGGVIGENKKSGKLTVTDGKDGTVTAVDVTCGGLSGSDLGGFIGWNKQDFYYKQVTTESVLDISDTTTTMQVSGTNSDVGGVIGQLEDAVLNGQWDRDHPTNYILVNDISITARTSSPQAKLTNSNLGGVVGYLQAGCIKGVEAERLTLADRKVAGTETDPVANNNRIGGLVGRAEQVFADIALTDLTIEVNGDSDTVGGAVGVYTSTTETPSNVTILSSSINNQAKNSVIGGFAGENTVTIENLSSADGVSIRLTSAQNATVGGLVGKNSGTLNTVTTSAEIVTPNTEASAAAMSSFRVGGLVGENTGTGTVKNSSRNRDITLAGSAAASNPSVLGGLIGENAGTVQQSYSACNLSTTGLGNLYVGGLIGKMSGGTVENCYTAADRTLKSEAASTYLGGFLGWYTSGNVGHCYSAMSVEGVKKSDGTSDKSGGFIACYDNSDSEIRYFTQNYFIQKQDGINTGLMTAASGEYLNFENYPHRLRAVTPEELAEQGGQKFRSYATAWKFDSIWRFDEMDKEAVGYKYPLLQMLHDPDSVTGRMSLNWYTDHVDAVNDGTEDGFHLKTEADMAGFAALVNGYAMGINAVDFHGATVYLDNAVSMQTNDWNAIGDDSDFPFAGTFDGQDKLISGLKDTAETMTDAAGLFGYTDSNAKIQNVKLSVSGLTSSTGAAAGLAAHNGGSIETVQVTLVDGATIQGKTHAGGVAGQSSGSIENAEVIGQVGDPNQAETIKATGTSSSYAGGVVGETSGTIENATVTLAGGHIGCENTKFAGGVVGYTGKAVSGELAVTLADVKGVDYAGGVVGCGTAVGASGVTTNVTVNATVTGASSGTNYVGGVAGKLTNGINATDMTVTAVGTGVSGGTYTGGIAGQAGAEIKAKTVAVTAKISGGNYVGGVVGNGTDVTVTDSATITGDLTVDGTGDVYVGGVMGNGDAVAVNTSVTITGDITANGTGTTYAGGILGNGEAVTVNDSATVTGDITAEGGETYVGGITGNGTNVKVTNTATVTGDISATGTDKTYAGGVAGCLSGNVSAKTVTVTAAGDIQATGTEKTYVGGVVGNGMAVTVNDTATIAGNITATGSSGETYAGGITGNGTSVSVTNNTATVTGNITANGGKTYAGGITGNGTTVTIPAIQITSDISANGTDKTYAGGVAGKLTDNVSAKTVLVTAAGGIQATGETETYVGGVVGSGMAVTVTDTATIEGNITANGGNGTTYAGGITGNGTSVSVTNTATVTGNISATGSGETYAGGVAGKLTDNVSAKTVLVTAAGGIQATGTEKTYVGGIVGNGKVVNVTDTATIEGNITATGGSGTTYAGGITGNGEAVTIPAIQITSDISATGSETYAGGVAGCLSGNVSAKTVTVTAQNGIYANGTTATCVGGIVGNGMAVTVNDTATIEGNITANGGNGTTYAGGITGNGTSVSVTNTATVTGNISATGSGETYAGGLLGNGDAVTVNDSATVTGNITANGGKTYAGGITGNGTSVTIPAIQITSDISATGSETYAGGVAGCLSGNVSAKTVTVTAQNGIYANGTTATCVGGIVGNGMAVTVNDTATIEGNITATGGSGTTYAGGITGNGTTVTIPTVQVKGNVGSTNSTDSYVGGVIGSGTDVTVTTATIEGNVTANGSGTTYAGGIAGKGEDITIPDVKVTGNIKGKTYVGGIAGEAVSVEVTEAEVKGNITGEDYVGGILGCGEAVADTTATITGNITGEDYVGGVAGKVGTVMDTTLNDTGTITGVTNVGGIAGQLTGSMENVVLNGKGTLSGAGKIAVVGKENVGGVIGYYKGTALNGSSDSETADITGLKLENIDVSSANVTVSDSRLGGLVGRLEDAVLTDSVLENITVTAVGNTMETDLGGIAGEAVNSIVSGVTVTNGTVSAGGCKDNLYVGGAVGKLTVDAANADQTWKLTDDAVLGAYQGVDRVTLTEMTVKADSGISRMAETFPTEKSAYVGGLVGGMNGGSVYHSTVSNGVISGTGYGKLYVGGAVGRAQAAYLVHNTVDCGVTAANAYRLFAGGFLGEMQESSARYNLVEPKDEKLLTVKENDGTTENPPTLHAGGFVGNIWGSESDQIRDNHVKTDVSVSNVDLNTSIYAGGFAGLAGRNEESPVTITACFAEADVTVVSEYKGSPAGAFANVGGFIGQLYTGTIESCYAQNELVKNVSHTARSGGFAGSIHEDKSDKESVVQDCYAVGDTVFAHGNTSYCGGFVGECEGTLSRVYADVKTKQGDNSRYIGDIVGEIRDISKQENAYSAGLTDQSNPPARFDFTTENSKWTYQPNVNGGRPVLTAFWSWDSEPDIDYLYQHAATNLTVANTDELGTVMALLNDAYAISDDVSLYELFTDGRTRVPLSVKLNTDLSLKSSRVWKLWIPEGASLDAQGHTLSGLDCELPDATVPAGLVIENAGTLKNLVLSAPKVVGNATVGGAMGENSGTAEQIVVLNADLTAKDCVGIVVGENAGTLKQATNYGEYVYRPTESKFTLGGIAGKNSGTVSESLNEANLKVEGCIMTLGGIAGESTGTVSACMTASGSMVSGLYGATTSSGGFVGGLVGHLTGATAMIKDSLSLSQVILLNKDGEAAKDSGAVVGKAESRTTVEKTYFDKRLSRVRDLKVSASDMAELVGQQVVAQDCFVAQENQYPILKWVADSSNTAIRNIGKLSTVVFQFADEENINSIKTPFYAAYGSDAAVKKNVKTAVANKRITLLAEEGSITLSLGGLSRTVYLANMDYEEKPSGGGGGGGGGGSAPVEEEPSGILIEVDGTNYDIGTAESDAMSATVKVDSEKLTERVREASEGSAVVVPLSDEKSVSKAVMTVGNVAEAAEKQLELEVVCGDVQIVIPTESIDTADVMKSFAGQKAEDVPFTVTVKTLSEPEKAELSRQTGHELLGDVVSFQVTAGSGNAVHNVKQFSAWTERVLPVEEAAKITTGVEIIGGKAIHKPTNVRTIHSLTDSVYAYIYHEVSFADAQGKWYADIVNEMASRLIVNGRDAATFDGDGTITRAEFAAILVRALGLHEDGDGTVFADVKAADWYCGAIGKAYEMGLIKGRDSTHFAPKENITREEAMVLMERAAKLTGLVGSSTAIDRFDDAAAVSGWALSAAKFNVGSGLIQGYDNRIHPRDSITRAESATVILRLLRMSDLVDVR